MTDNTDTKPTGFYDSDIGGFTVEDDEHHRWGPFATPDDAAKWAIDNLPAGGQWSIRPFLSPDGESALNPDFP